MVGPGQSRPDAELAAQDGNRVPQREILPALRLLPIRPPVDATNLRRALDSTRLRGQP
jgi:hypothetical protein